MSKYIKLDDALMTLSETCYLDEIDEQMQKLPSIEIVFCKECKHQWREHKVCAHEANVVEGVCGKRAEDNDFCSYGVRKGEDDER
jgi:ribosomal protein L32